VDGRCVPEDQIAWTSTTAGPSTSCTRTEPCLGLVHAIPYRGARFDLGADEAPP
jgi:hypothetical protein